MVDLALVANLATALAVIVALTVGLVQIHQFNRKRRDMAAMELVHALQTPTFAEASQVVMALPDHADPKLLLGKAEVERAILTVNFVFETLGAMVFHRVLPLLIVDDVIGQFCQVAWRKVDLYYAHLRERDATKGYAEWHQWLAERLAELDRPQKKAGAFAAYKDWRP